MNKKMIVGLMVAGILTMPSLVIASSTGTVKLTVTVTGTADIEVWYLNSAVQPGTYDFGNAIGVDGTAISCASVTVKNTSDALNEDWYIRASNARGDTDWTLGASAGKDIYNLRAVLNSDSEPADGAFGAEDNLSNDSAAMNATNFAGSENGLNVTKGDTRGLWFRIHTPTSVSGTDEHTIFVTIYATQSS